MTVISHRICKPTSHHCTTPPSTIFKSRTNHNNNYYSSLINSCCGWSMLEQGETAIVEWLSVTISCRWTCCSTCTWTGHKLLSSLIAFNFHLTGTSLWVDGRGSHLCSHPYLTRVLWSITCCIDVFLKNKVAVAFIGLRGREGKGRKNKGFYLACLCPKVPLDWLSTWLWCWPCQLSYNVWFDVSITIIYKKWEL